MNKKEIEIHVDKDNKIDFKEFIEMKIKYDEEYFKKDKEIERLKSIIKEAIEYINNEQKYYEYDFDYILEILDKGSDEISK